MRLTKANMQKKAEKLAELYNAGLTHKLMANELMLDTSTIGHDVLPKICTIP